MPTTLDSYVLAVVSSTVTATQNNRRGNSYQNPILAIKGHILFIAHY